MAAHNFFQVANFQLHRLFLAVEFNNQMRAATPEALALRPIVSGSESKRISYFERAGQKPGFKNRMDGPDGGVHGAKTDGEAGAIRWQRDELQCGLGDDAEHAFGARKEAREFETGFVLVRASTDAGNGAVR